MKPYMHKKVSLLAVEHPLERRAIQTAVVLLVCFSCAYLYLVTASILDIMGQREADRKVTSTESSIALLEQRYFNLSQSIDPAQGRSLGLAPIESTSYVYRERTVGDSGASRTSTSI